MMTNDDIFRMAQEAGAFVLGDFIEAGEMDIEQFANLVAATEREECAYIADQGFRRAAEGDEIADLIRARGQE
jgi:hypothetical protein